MTNITNILSRLSAQTITTEQAAAELTAHTERAIADHKPPKPTPLDMFTALFQQLSEERPEIIRELFQPYIEEALNDAEIPTRDDVYDIINNVDITISASGRW